MLPDPELLEFVSFQNASPYEYACYFITKNSMSEFATDVSKICVLKEFRQRKWQHSISNSFLYDYFESFYIKHNFSETHLKRNVCP